MEDLSVEDSSIYQREILEHIVNHGVLKVSYHHPEHQLGYLARDHSLILEKLRELESLGVMKLNPHLKFGRWPYFWPFGETCGYEVDKEKATRIFGDLFRD